MGEGTIDFDFLIGAWRGAFESAQRAIAAAAHDNDLDNGEVQARSRLLADERAAAVQSLGGLARELHSSRPGLVRLLTSPREAKQLLGLPPDAGACVFNADGVLVPSAAIHADVWKRTFDRFLSQWMDRSGATIATFSRRIDYPLLIHGRSRLDAVRGFLASRGMSLPEGNPTDPPGTQTVYGLANAKSDALVERLRREGVSAFDGARLFLALANDAGLPCAVVSGSTTISMLLEGARLAPLIDCCIDGTVAEAQGLRRKPAPDMLLAATRALGVDPARTAVFETDEEGVIAGRTGGFEFVVAVDQEGQGKKLRACGADIVVSDLGEILERALG